MRIDPQSYAALAAHIRDEFPEDDQLLADTLEGETDFMEVMDRVLAEKDEAEANAAALKALIGEYQDRKAAMEAKAQRRREVIQALLMATGQRNLTHPRATVSLRAVPPKAVFLGDVTALSDDLRNVKITPNLTALKAALTEGVVIPGAHLTNGGETVSIRRA